MLAHNLEKIYRLEPLPKESALKLLISKAPRRISNKEIKELIETKAPEESKLGESLNYRQHINDNQDPSLLDHPFTMLLGGHPQAISLAAPILKDSSLKQLFLTF